MKIERRHIFSILIGSVVLLALIGLTIALPPSPSALIPGILFCLLILFTTTFGVPLGGGSVSLLPMTMGAAYLVMGLLPTCWAALVGTVIHGWFRHRGSERSQESFSGGVRSVGLTAANVTMYLFCIIFGDAVFGLLGGTTPLLAVEWGQVVPLVLFGTTFLFVNYVIAGIYIAARGKRILQSYFRSLPNLLFYEGAPLIFAPLMALVHNRLGVIQFSLFALVLVVGSLIARNLAFASRRLERRVKELQSLQAVGQALSASLDTETIVSAIYAQVADLMPANNFYVALYDPHVAEVSFPLAVEEGRPAHWASRQTGNGLTEYILRTRAPLLVAHRVRETLQSLGIAHIGKEAACWLGVPLLAGDEPLGVIAVQSYDQSQEYDDSHLEILQAIAAQAAIAIQNARLYARTDEALARRVQELDSILRTTSEGILLLDTECRILAVNRALAELVGMAQLELIGQALDGAGAQGEHSLCQSIGYVPDDLFSDLKTLQSEEKVQAQGVFLGPTGRHIQRTLTPVRDREGAINGWLFLLRDITEEVELAHLKDDLANMLVHDLRSPLTAVIGSLGLMERAFDRQEADRFARLLAMAQRGSERMLGMVNELLDIRKLESGQLHLASEEVDGEKLLRDTAGRLSSVAAAAKITLHVSVEPALPMLDIDLQLVSRVINNLLDNAIKFTPDGGRVELWARPEPGDHVVRVGITDTGPGIPLQAQPRLFEMFQQVDSIEGRRRGTGLGLPFCKLVVEAHHGRIWVESQVGQGSTFVMTLPAARV